MISTNCKFSDQSTYRRGVSVGDNPRSTATLPIPAIYQKQLAGLLKTVKLEHFAEQYPKDLQCLIEASLKNKPAPTLGHRLKILDFSTQTNPEIKKNRSCFQLL